MRIENRQKQRADSPSAPDVSACEVGALCRRVVCEPTAKDFSTVGMNVAKREARKHWVISRRLNAWSGDESARR